MKENLRIKICGLRDPDNIEDILELRPDYVGFIFYPKSSRFIGDKLPKTIMEEIEEAKKVGVFVDESYADIQAAIDKYDLDVVQLHGNELPELCAEVQNYGVDVIKAISIDENFNFKILKVYERAVDFFLFDTKGELPGGNGVPFDWEILSKYKGRVPFFLSGGISPDHADAINEFEHPRLIGIDLNSKFEVKPGVKNVELLENFFDQVRPADYWEY